MRITNVRELHVYGVAYEAALHIFALSSAWPAEERYALTDQVRRSSRPVCANIAEAWAKRNYPRHFVSKPTDALAESDEAGVWLDFAHAHGYLTEDTPARLRASYRSVASGLVRMSRHPGQWRVPPPPSGA